MVAALGTALIATGFTDFGVAMLVILAAFLGIAIGYLAFKFGWRRIKQASH